MEVFTFLYMGGELDKIIFLPMTNESEDASLAGRSKKLDDSCMSATMEAFACFDAKNAQCFKPEDKNELLGVIESGMGSIAAFNKSVRRIFGGFSEPAKKRRAKSGRRSSRTKVGPVDE